MNNAIAKPMSETLANQRHAWRAESRYTSHVASRFHTPRSATRAGADDHYTETDLDRLREAARDMERNDAAIAALLNIAVSNIIGANGFTYEPDTGDADVDRELYDRVNDWRNDARQCDHAGRHTFTQQEELVMRGIFRDGDAIALPVDRTLALQHIEAQRLTTPKSTKRNVVSGVRLDGRDRPVEYWISRAPRKSRGWVARVADVDQIPAYRSNGLPAVLHMFNPMRVSQTRGVTAFEPIIEYASMLSDLDFAQLVKAQSAALVGLFIEKHDVGGFAPSDPLGERSTDADGQSLIDLRPGMVHRLGPGERAQLLSANIPNAEYFKHVEHVLRLIGLSLGVPLSQYMMNASDTNFSGWRGALDEARKGYSKQQTKLEHAFHRPVIRWLLFHWQRRGLLSGRAANMPLDDLSRHVWHKPTFPYIEPSKDAKAEATQLANLLESPRALAAKRSKDFEKIAGETVADNEFAIRLALEARERLVGQYPDAAIDWRDVLFLRSRVNADNNAEPVEEGE